MASNFKVHPLRFTDEDFACLTFSFLGVPAALLAKSHEDMGTFSSIILLPMTFLGGTFFSLSQVPVGLKFALYLLPLTHASLRLRAAALNQSLPWTSFLLLLIFFAAFIGGSMIAVRKMSI